MGLFDEAGVSVENVSDDPYNFKNEYWPVAVKEVRDPKVSEKGSYGSYMLFEIMHDKYASVPAFGNWIKLPTPKAIQQDTGIAFDPENNPRDMGTLFSLVKFFEALGFKRDEMNRINIQTDLVGRVFLARLRAKEENGYWKISYNAPQPMPEAGSDAFAEFAKKSSSVSGTDDIEAAMRAEMS